MKKIPLIILALVAIPVISHADTRVTPERSFLRQISALVDHFQKKHQAYPTSWSDLEKIYGDPSMPLDEIFYYIEPTKTYRFAEENLTLPVDDDDDYYLKTILISKGPIQDLTFDRGLMGSTSEITEGKYFALVVMPQGEIIGIDLSPQTVANRYESAGIAMPTPIEIPERIWVGKARDRMVERYACYAFLGLLVALVLYRVFRKYLHAWRAWFRMS